MTTEVSLTHPTEFDNWTDDQIAELRAQMRSSPSLFHRTIVMPQYPMKDFHVAMLKWPGIIHEGRQFSGILAPRGSAKTDVGTIGQCLHTIVVDPNRLCQIIAESEKLGKKFLFSIKWHLRHNERLKIFFGSFWDKFIPWTNTEISTTQRTIWTKEPSIAVFGARGAITGTRATDQFLDDISTPRTAGSPTVRQNLIEWYFTTVCKILVPGGRQYIRGTRYFTNDLYTAMIEVYGKDIFLIIPALFEMMGKVDPRAFPNGVISLVEDSRRKTIPCTPDACLYPKTYTHSFWPERFPLFNLIQELKKDPKSFITQMMNDISILNNSYLNEGSLKFCPDDMRPKWTDLVGWIGVDPARKITGAGSLFALSCLARDQNTGLLYVVYEDRDRLATPDKQAEFITRAYKHLTKKGMTIKEIRIESNAYQGILENHMKENWQKYGVMPIVGADTLKDKEASYIAQTKWFNMGLVSFFSECYALMADFGKFPDCEYPDVVDALLRAFEAMGEIGTPGMALNIGLIDKFMEGGINSWN